jgi:hypothetical protein
MRKRSSIFILNIMKLIPNRMHRERRYFYFSIQTLIAINYRSESFPISPMAQDSIMLAELRFYCLFLMLQNVITLQGCHEVHC